MLRLVSVYEQAADHITFQTEEFTGEAVPYVMFDTSTGVSIYSPNYTEDYPAWRATAIATSTGSAVYRFTINNSNLYPATSKTIADYTTLSPRLFKTMTLQEYTILNDVLIRFDLVRRRLPNPGIGLASTDGIGEDGVVAFTGGHEKKMMISEIMSMGEGAILEINGTPPRTQFWPVYLTPENDKIYNPYYSNAGIPNDMMELAKMGTLIRCLIAMGILEVDISFSTSDSGLQLTFDRAAGVKGWHDALITEYKEMKSLFKWNHANHAGVGVGTVPWSATGIWGTLMNNATSGGTLGLTSLLGFTARGNTPL